MLFALPVRAQSFDSAAPSADQPVEIEADRMAYDSKTKTAVAAGKVKVTQQGRYVLADTLIYQQAEAKVIARGHVELHEPDGSVFHAEEVQLKDDLRDGVIERLRARFFDDSTLDASKATRRDGNVSTFENARYTACKLCTDSWNGKEIDPTWQIKADKVIYNEAKETITYDDAWLEFWGVPLIYTPYFSHPSPGAPSKSGILIPKYQVSSQLGTVVEVPFFWAIAPDKQAVITPVYASLEEPILKGEYEQRVRSGRYKIGGSITYPDKRDGLGLREDGQEFRGHFSGDGRFELDDIWAWGFDVTRATDDTYLRRYDIMNADSLNSRLYLEGIGRERFDRTYALVEGITFQDLRLETQPLNAERTPFILPELFFTHQTDPGWRGSRFEHEIASRAMTRSGGQDSQMVSMKSAWHLPHVTDSGHVLGFTASLRGDAYNVDGYLPAPASPQDHYTETRVIPEAVTSWRYPLIHRGDRMTVLLEPRIEAAISPTGYGRIGIPDEDSQVEEFSASNLFEANRYVGYDRVETGARVNYGLTSALTMDDGVEYSTFLGQSYHWDDDYGQLFSANPDNHYSDYVGMLSAAYELLDIAYRFRMDSDSLEMKRHEVNAWTKLNPVYFMAEFTQLVDDPNLGDREEVFLGMSYVINDQWLWTTGARRNLLSDEMINARTSLTFQNECLQIIGSINREYTRDRDIEPNTSYTLQLLLRNLN